MTHNISTPHSRSSRKMPIIAVLLKTLSRTTGFSSGLVQNLQSDPELREVALFRAEVALFKFRSSKKCYFQRLRLALAWRGEFETLQALTRVAARLQQTWRVLKPTQGRPHPAGNSRNFKKCFVNCSCRRYNWKFWLILGYLLIQSWR